MSEINTDERWSMIMFEDGVSYTKSLRVINDGQKSADNSLTRWAENLPGPKYAVESKDFFEDISSEVHEAYEKCKELNFKYNTKNHELFRQELRTLDEKLARFNTAHRKINEIIKSVIGNGR
jgi:hypothetical protein